MSYILGAHPSAPCAEWHRGFKSPIQVLRDKAHSILSINRKYSVHHISQYNKFIPPPPVAVIILYIQYLTPLLIFNLTSFPQPYENEVWCLIIPHRFSTLFAQYGEVKPARDKFIVYDFPHSKLPQYYH